jgi:hypothetical protein
MLWSAPTASAEHFTIDLCLLLTAPWTAEAIRPPQPNQILPTGRLGGEAGLEFGQISRVLFHRTPYYIWGHLSEVDTPIIGF